MRRYYLHKRKNIYYAELISPEGRRSTAKSTGKTTESEALLVVSQWLSTGIPKKGKEKPIETVMGLSEILKAIKKIDLDENDAIKIVESLKKKDLIDFTVTKKGSGAKLFTDFLEEFWDWNSSPYVREKKAHKKSIGKRHCYEMQSRVHAFYSEHFEGRTLESITWKDLYEFSLFISEKREKPENYKGNFAEELSPSYRNKILIAGKTALRWAYEQEIITTDPTAKAKKISFAVSAKKRRVLTPQEAEVIFNKTQWDDKRSYIGNLLSITTGMRAGEILALKKSDIGENIIFCRHSYCIMDGLKTPKNGEERKIPLLPEVKNKLMELLSENPHTELTDPFIFYGLLPDQPMDHKLLNNGLKAACKAAGIKPAVTHSLRHYYTARLSDKMTADQVMRITGHKTRAVYEVYQDHLVDKNIEDMAEAAAEVFSNIIQFPMKKAV